MNEVETLKARVAELEAIIENGRKHMDTLGKALNANADRADEAERKLKAVREALK